jgi:IS5 family transposase
MYWLSNPELKRQAKDKISFLKFLGFPDKIPVRSTVKYLWERLLKTRKDKVILKEL